MRCCRGKFGLGWDAVGSRMRLSKGGGGGRYPCCLQCQRPVAAGDGSVPRRTTGEATCRYPLCPFVFCGFRFWEGRGTLDSDVHTPHHLEPASHTCPFLHHHQVSLRKRAVREKGALDIILFSPVDPAQSLRPFLSLTILQHSASAPSHGCCSKLGGSPARRRPCVAICLPFSSRPCGHDAPLEGL